MKRKSLGNGVAAYRRVSDESQVDGHSLDAQLSEIQRWCDEKGYVLVAVFTDAGVSAYTDKIVKRPDFARLLDAAEAGDLDIVVVHTLDRWARNSSVLAESLQRLGNARVGFASVTEQIDYTTPAGKMVLTTLGAAQEFFSAQTGVHVRKSHRQNASQGIAIGPAPFSLMRPDARSPLQPIPGEAEAVNEAFQMRCTGASCGTIARRLNEQGFRTRKGRRFTSHAVKDLLRCRVYIGVVRCGDEEFTGKHEAIVDRALFDDVQSLWHPRAGARLVRGLRGVLQGRVSCVRCGNQLHSDRQYRSGLPMYRERHAFECDTNNHACMAGAVDDQMGKLFASLAIPDDWRERMAALAAKRGCESIDVTALQERKRRIYQIHEDGGYRGDSEYKENLAAVDAQIRKAQPASLVRVDECVALLDDLSELWSAKRLRKNVLGSSRRSSSACTSTSRPAASARSRRRLASVRCWRACWRNRTGSAYILLPAEAANQPDWWTWWRRGRIELPVQVTDALSLLQAYPVS